MQRTKFCRSPKTTSVWWVWEREHEPDCLSNLQFVSGGGGKRQFLYYIFSYLYIYRHTRIDDEHMQYIFNIWMYRIRVFMCVFSATNARKQLSFGLEPEFRSSVAFCARFAAPFVHTYIHRYIQTSLRMPRTAMCECVCVCVCVCFLHSVLTGIYAFTAFVLIVLIINSITLYCLCLFSM